MKRKCVVKQNDIRDCGICCLESIIKYYDGYVPLETLRLDTKTDNSGTSAYNLIKAAKKYGFNAMGKKINELDKNIILPAIAHIITEKGLKHFVVIYEIKKEYVVVMDPATGYRKIPTIDFKDVWTNVILIFQPYKEIPLYKLNNNILNLFQSLCKKENYLIKRILIINIIITILSIIMSYHLKLTIGNINTSYKNTIIFISIIFLYINIYKIYYTYTKNKLSIYLNKNINLHLIPTFINYILNLPLDVIKSRTTGEILTRVEELNNIKDLFSEILIGIILDIFLILTSSIFLYNTNKELFFILCIISLLLVLIGILSAPLINKRISENIDLITEFNGSLTETIENLESIKNLNIVNKENQKLENEYTNYQKDLFTFSGNLNLLETINSFIYEIGLFSITSYGIFLIINNRLSFISLITFASLISYFIDPIKDILSLIPKFLHIKLSFQKIEEFINIEKEELGSKEELLMGDIKFNKIKYSYDDYNMVINNCNITIPKYKHVTIKGPTGMGKSTLFKMLNKSITGYKGNITINDIDIKDYSLNTLRTNILYVSQHENLFDDTILNNITLYKKIPHSILKEVLEMTKVDEILNKKSLRLDTYVYNNGFNLSGGEIQRLILARSILYNPKILILDESLSEVDNKTEKEIVTNLDNYLPTTTIIYITHTSDNYFKDLIEMDELICSTK